MSKICVSITHAKDDVDKATVGFVIANASIASDQETVVFLSPRGRGSLKKVTPTTFTRRASRRSRN